MDRKEIKEQAKCKIKGNLWKLLWPLLAISLISAVLSKIIAPNYNMTTQLDKTISLTPTQSILLLIVTLITGIAAIAYQKYAINFTRTGKCDFKDIVDCLKEKWVNILVIEILVGLLVTIGAICLIVPGIILAFAYAMTSFLIVDTDLSPIDAMKKSRDMMKGYKIDYFVFALSFVGWVLLIIPTIGIITIWLIPYMMVAETLYYDKLKVKSKK